MWYNSKWYCVFSILKISSTLSILRAVNILNILSTLSTLQGHGAWASMASLRSQGIFGHAQEQWHLLQGNLVQTLRLYNHHGKVKQGWASRLQVILMHTLLTHHLSVGLLSSIYFILMHWSMSQFLGHPCVATMSQLTNVPKNHFFKPYPLHHNMYTSITNVEKFIFELTDIEIKIIEQELSQMSHN